MSETNTMSDSTQEWREVFEKPDEATIEGSEYQCITNPKDSWPWDDAHPNEGEPASSAAWDFDNTRYRIRPKSIPEKGGSAALLSDTEAERVAAKRINELENQLSAQETVLNGYKRERDACVAVLAALGTYFQRHSGKDEVRIMSRWQNIGSGSMPQWPGEECTPFLTHAQALTVQELLCRSAQ
jgi:hypothetical protein